jgi:pimeloyl-ACP methyl ester carboxylesterase
MSGLARDPQVVLVHGSAHGAWCWDAVRDGLTAAGIQTHTLDLPLTGLHDDAAAVTAVLDSLPGPVLLVGHSYGGAVIGEAGAHDAVARLVYLAALIPDVGQSAAASMWSDAADPIDAAGHPTAASALATDDAGRFSIPAEAAAAMFYNECDPEVAAKAAAQLRPQSLTSLQEVPTAFAWQTKPSTYVICTNDLTVAPDRQRGFAARCTDSVAWASDHSPFLSHPNLVINLLTSMARG